MMRRPDIININGKRYFQKHTVSQRIQTVLQIISVVVLALTGIPLRYADQSWAHDVYNYFGGPEVVPSVHRSAGLLLLSVFVYHTLYWFVPFINNNLVKPLANGEFTFRKFLKEFFSQTMIINRKDIRDVIDHLKYILYISNKPAMHDRIMWKEKFEYYAQYWGITVIGIAGLILWQRDFISHYLPGIFINAAYIMHTYEALLAVLFLLFIHWYHEYYSPEKFPVPTGFFSGYISERQMVHEHYARYAQLMKEAGLEDEIREPH